MNKNNKFHQKLIKGTKSLNEAYQLANKAIADYAKGTKNKNNEKRNYFLFKIKEVDRYFKENY